MLSLEKEKTFVMLQQLFIKSTFLVHFDSFKHLYINVDVSKQYKFKAVVYYMNDDSQETADIQ